MDGRYVGRYAWCSADGRGCGVDVIRMIVEWDDRQGLVVCQDEVELVIGCHRFLQTNNNMADATSISEQKTNIATKIQNSNDMKVLRIGLSKGKVK